MPEVKEKSFLQIFFQRFPIPKKIVTKAIKCAICEAGMFSGLGFLCVYYHSCIKHQMLVGLPLFTTNTAKMHAYMCQNVVAHVLSLYTI